MKTFKNLISVVFMFEFLMISCPVLTFNLRINDIVELKSEREHFENACFNFQRKTSHKHHANEIIKINKKQF